MLSFEDFSKSCDTVFEDYLQEQQIWRKTSQQFLFPLPTLSQHVHKSTRLGQLSGDVFEELSQELTGARRIYSSNPFVPDLFCEKEKCFYESKGSKHIRRIWIDWAQLHQHAASAFCVKYLFWAYAAPKAEGQTARECVQAMANGIKFVVQVSPELLLLYAKKYPMRVRDYGEKWGWSLRLDQSFFNKLLTQPHLTLFSLDTDAFLYEIKTTQERLDFQYQGEQFQTEPFQVLRVFERPETVVERF